MAYWLAERRKGQDFDYIQRFDPRFWTVNFPRPMMASAVTTAPDALRVEAVFHHSDELAGLIWDSADTLDHPLLAYRTERDYDHCALSFRWRSQGIMPLDAVNGPTLTIEGRDAAGNSRSWYVRLWNYAEGTPEDAAVRIDFTALDGGFLLPGEADPVHPGDIDRMFISLVPPGYDMLGTRFAEPQEGWVELTQIRCDGERAVIEIGDVQLPPHAMSLATAYDDSFNQTPARLLRQVRSLGYAGPINHYVGMSHYFRLEANGDGLYVSLAGPSPLNAPCAAWHRDYAAKARDAGYGLIFSLSYELFDAHCWNDWKQRAENGDPALTGWVPPSALLSPAHAGAMGYLQAVGRAFAAILRDAGQPVRFQIGEPWWWVMLDSPRICLYDAAATAALGALSVSIPDITAPLDAAQRAMLDAAGDLLAASTAALADAVRDEAGAAGAELLLLVYLPTVLDAAAPNLKRANVPLGWAAPAFDILQLEDYDWTSAGNFAAQRRGLAEMQARLGYPPEKRHYFSGFVLRPEDEAQWAPIERSARLSRARGEAATFIWALPQVARDGFTRFDLSPEEDEMQAFDDVTFPVPLGRDVTVATGFSTQVTTSISGHERRNAEWADARLSFDAGPGVRSEAELAELVAFFRARRGAARGFRLRDPFDHSSNGAAGIPSLLDQPIGTGDGLATEFALVKLYGEGDEPQARRITRPVAASIRVAVDGVETLDWTLGDHGMIEFADPPAAGAAISAGFLFDVPVRFAEDRLEFSQASFAAGEMPSVPLVEIREGAA